MKFSIIYKHLKQILPIILCTRQSRETNLIKKNHTYVIKQKLIIIQTNLNTLLIFFINSYIYIYSIITLNCVLKHELFEESFCMFLGIKKELLDKNRSSSLL